METPPEIVDLLVEDAFVITMNPERDVYRNGFVAVQGERIVATGPMNGNPFIGTKTLNGSGLIVMPGIVNAHDHLAQSLFRGSLDEAGPSSARRGGLFFHSMALTRDRAYAAAGLTLLELTRYGVTTTHDSHFTHAHKDSIDGVLEALVESKLRGIVARAINDTDALPRIYRETIDEALQELERLEERWDSATVTIIPEAVGTLRNTPDAIQAMHARAVERDTLWHMHLAQNFGERDATVEKYGCGAVELLAQLGVLDERLLAAHCVGIIVDGAGTNNGQNPWEMAKVAVYMQKHRFGDYSIGSAELGLEWITIEAARALGLEDRIGSIEPGKDADLVFLDRLDPSLMPDDKLPSHLIYALDPRAILEVVIRGETVFSNGEHVFLDRESIVAEAEFARREMLDELGDPEPRRSPWHFID